MLPVGPISNAFDRAFGQVIDDWLVELKSDFADWLTWKDLAVSAILTGLIWWGIRELLNYVIEIICDAAGWNYPSDTLSNVFATICVPFVFWAMLILHHHFGYWDWNTLVFSGSEAQP